MMHAMHVCKVSLPLTDSACCMMWEQAEATGVKKPARTKVLDLQDVQKLRQVEAPASKAAAAQSRWVTVSRQVEKSNW